MPMSEHHFNDRAPHGEDGEGPESMPGQPGQPGQRHLSRDWVHQGGYSMRAPVPHVHAEVRSSQRREEEKYAKLIAENL